MKKTRSQKPHIVLITVDCLRSGSLGLQNSRVKTPFLDSLIKKGIYFKKAIPSSPWSAGSGVSIFTGSYPFEYNGDLTLTKRGKSFVEELQRNGYVTIGVHSNPFFTAEHKYNRGFDVFYDWYSLSGKHINGLKEHLGSVSQKRHIRNKRINKIVIKIKHMLSRIGFLQIGPKNYANADTIHTLTKKIISYSNDTYAHKPKFLWVHYMDMHEPITIPRSFIPKSIAKKVRYLNSLFIKNNKKLSENDIRDLKQLYYSSIEYIDGKIEELIHFLIEKLGEDTVFILTADHGQQLGERNYLGHGLKHTEELLNVPLILFAPSLIKDPSQKETDTFVPLQAIGNVILDFASLDDSFGRLHSFFHKDGSITAPQYVIAEEGREDQHDFLNRRTYRIDWDKRSFSVFKGKYYYVNYVRRKKEELYLIGKRENVASLNSNQNILSNFRKILDNHISTYYSGEKLLDRIQI